MAEISKITLPSGNTYDIKDAVAREMIAGSVSYNIGWDGTGVPDITKIPAGVVVTYNDTDYTGTMSAESAQPGEFVLVKSSNTAQNSYSEYVAVGTTGSKTWEKMGDTVIDLSNLGDLAYLDTVTLSKGSGDNVLGEATTFTTTVTPTTTNIKATASGTAVGADGTASAVTGYSSTSSDTFVKSYPGTTSKMVTTSIPNVTTNTSATISFAMGTGDNSETLVISGTGFSGNTYTATNTALGTAITAATGALANNGGGASVMTGLGNATTASALTDLGTPSTSTVLTGVKVTTQPTVALSTDATAGTGVISVATGITDASTTAGNNDTISIAKYGDLSVSVS